MEIDPAFKGIDGSDLVKVNPLANITSAEVITTIQTAFLPTFPLVHRATKKPPPGKKPPRFLLSIVLKKKKELTPYHFLHLSTGMGINTNERHPLQQPPRTWIHLYRL